LKHLIIFHYHFLAGGVTDVVVSAVQAYLRYSEVIGKITIVSGRSDNLDSVIGRIIKPFEAVDRKRLSSVILDEIDYTERLKCRVTTESLKHKLMECFHDSNSIWWIHNYNLGKNPYFTGALLKIAEGKNQKMVFHIHDFCECSRYELLERLTSTVNGDLYSLEKTVRYTVINRRDYNYLLESGIPKEKLFLLENPLSTDKRDYKKSDRVIDALSKSFKNSFPGWRNNIPYMLYPVRSIRRKNVGEAALLSLLSEVNVIVTLPGVSERERTYSESVKSIFTQGLAHGLFGIGEDLDSAGLSFTDLISSASLILSTSIQEGFGYLFLNSLNWGKPLIARNLDVLESFKWTFQDYDAHFYKGLFIPAAIIDRDRLTALYRDKISRLSPYLSTSLIENLFCRIDTILGKRSIDFSYLTLQMQIDILKKINTERNLWEQCRRENEDVLNYIKKFLESDSIHRKKLLDQKWSFESYSRQTDSIINSFTINHPLADQTKLHKPIYESLLERFASMPFLRLLYDE